MLNFERLWSNAGHFSLALAKSAKTTTWIWDLHADAHDFDFPINLHQASSHRLTLAANLAHLSVVLLWLAGMHFHGAYLSNVTAWQSDPTHCIPSASFVWSIVGQDVLNSDVGSYFQGQYITSGLFHLWRSQGLVTSIHLKYASSAALIGSIACLLGSYFHQHIGFQMVHWFRKFKSTCYS